MMKCKNECPNERANFNGCCAVCPGKASCEDACAKDPATCGDSIPDVENDETALAAFREQHAAVMDSVAALIRRKKAREEQEAELKSRLQTAMEDYEIKKFTSDILNITYVAATNAESIDTTKLKAKYPAIAAECVKIGNRKAYVKIELKGDK
jgi:hypothetical protein